jgi:hypothetical protein
VLLLESWAKSGLDYITNERIKAFDKSVASIIQVDEFMMSIRNFLAFNEYPCVMYARYMYTAKFHEVKTLSSKVEFVEQLGLLLS